jgi:hypothetical protein
MFCRYPRPIGIPPCSRLPYTELQVRTAISDEKQAASASSGRGSVNRSASWGSLMWCSQCEAWVKEAKEGPSREKNCSGISQNGHNRPFLHFLRSLMAKPTLEYKVFKKFAAVQKTGSASTCG